jgi:hypothetical protein
MSGVVSAVYHDRALQLANAMELCHDDVEAYSSAIALLAVHCAISFGDAILIQLTGQRSRAQDHRVTVEKITAACRKARLQTAGVHHLSKLVGAKSDVSYGDKVVDQRIAEVQYQTARRFQAWAERILGSGR